MAQIRRSYDAVAHRYAAEIGGELTGKPLDRALLACLVELCTQVEPGDGQSDEGGRSGPVRVIADIGCGPGHVSTFLTGLGASVIGVDLSPRMVEVASQHFPELRFVVGSLLELPVATGGLAGAVCAYSIIHLTSGERRAAYHELARAIAPGGWLLVSFHIDEGEPVRHLDQWWDHPVDLDFYFLDPADVTKGLEAAGFMVMVRTDRRANPALEVDTRRCYLLAQRRG